MSKNQVLTFITGALICLFLFYLYYSDSQAKEERYWSNYHKVREQVLKEQSFFTSSNPPSAIAESRVRMEEKNYIPLYASAVVGGVTLILVFVPYFKKEN